MEDTLTYIFNNGLEDFYTHLNPLFMTVIALSMWLLNDSIDATNFAKNFSKFSKIPRLIRSLIPSIFWGVIFYWVFKYNNRLEVFDLILSTFGALIVYKLGVCKLLRWVSVKVFKLEFLPVE